jgi:hypothetical protein
MTAVKKANAWARETREILVGLGDRIFRYWQNTISRRAGRFHEIGMNCTLKMG